MANRQAQRNKLTMRAAIVAVILCAMALVSSVSASAAPLNGTSLISTRNNSRSSVPSPTSDVSSSDLPQSFYTGDSSWDGSASSSSVSLPVEHACLSNQFWSEAEQSCMNCTVCHPGTGHQNGHAHCGSGAGSRDVCIPCRDGFFQNRTLHSGARCRRCITCDPSAEVLAECRPTDNRECGPCPNGTYAVLDNVCFKCKAEDDSPSCVGHVHAVTSPAAPAGNPRPSPSTHAAASPATSLATPPDMDLPSTESPDAGTAPSPTKMGISVRKVSAFTIAPIIVALLLVIIVYALRNVIKKRLGQLRSKFTSRNAKPSSGIQSVPMQIVNHETTGGSGERRETLQYVVQRQNTPEVTKRNDATPEADPLLGAGSNHPSPADLSDPSCPVSIACNSMSLPQPLLSSPEANIPVDEANVPVNEEGAAAGLVADVTDGNVGSLPQIDQGPPALLLPWNSHGSWKPSSPNAVEHGLFEGDENDQLSLPQPLSSL